MRFASAGSEVRAAKCSITSSPSTSSISGGLGMIIWPIITKTARTSDWRRRHRQDGRLKHSRTKHATFWPCLESAVFIIAMPGHKQLNNDITNEQPVMLIDHLDDGSITSG